MRKVMVSARKKLIDGSWKVTEKGEAIFHLFGFDHEEYDGGPGNYTSAIVEWPDGTVESVFLHHIRFIEPAKGNAK